MRCLATMLVGGCLWLSAMAPRARAADVDLATMLDEQGAFWQLSPDAFMATATLAVVFTWMDRQQHDEAGYLASRSPTAVEFVGQRVEEATVRFVKGHPARLELSLYNRGDSGPEFGRKRFEAQVAAIKASISTWAGSPGVAGARQRVLDNVQLLQHGWVRGPYALDLTWNTGSGSDRKFRAEYIQLAIEPAGRASTSATRTSVRVQLAGTASRTDLKANVRRDRDGSVCIVGIPMVDQGDKGYCAAAVAERILRYYGTEVTQHVIAQMSDTSAGEGTDPDAMLKALKRAGVKFGIRLRELKSFNGDEFLALLNRYNSFAKRNKVRPVEVKPVQGVVLVSDLYAQMEPKTLRRFMCEEQKRGYKAFLADVTHYVQLGIPLAWSVELGLFEEPMLRAGPQEGGSHLRIVSGYDPQTQAIVYTDSWGAGHESKRMPMDNAWAMTVGLYVLEPRKR